MKNKYEQLSFIKALIDQLDHQARLPAKIYFNYFSPNFDVKRQKEVLIELKSESPRASARGIITEQASLGHFLLFPKAAPIHPRATARGFIR